jgi:uncharacterized protein involved in exopolysaccharide biosynthesis
MSDLEKYHGQLIEQRPANFEMLPESDSHSTSNLIKGVLRRWYIVLLIFFVMCAIGIPAIWLSIEPLYIVTGAIRVAPILEDIWTGEADSGGISNYSNFMYTEAERITSSRVVQKAATDLADKNLDFFENEPTGFVTKLKQTLKNTKTNREPASVLKRAISAGVISAAPARRTELIKITMKSTNASEAKQIVDALISTYRDIEVTSASKDEGQKLDVLTTDKKKLAEKLRGYHERKQKLAQEYGTTELDPRKEMMLELVKLLRTELTNLQLRRINLGAQVKVLEETEEQPIAPEDLLRLRNEYITSDLTTQELTRKIVDMEENLIVSEQALAPENPVLKQKGELLDTFQSRLKEKRQEVGKTFDDMVAEQAKKTGRNKLRQVQAELEQTKMHEKHLSEVLVKEDTKTI